jgi:PEP-CTERM motif
MKKMLALLFIGCLALAGGARAQYLTGNLTGEAMPGRGVGNATASSMQLSWSNMVDSASGSFAGIVAVNSQVATSGFEIDGLSTTPTTVSISPFFTFFNAFAPVRFRFDLTTLTEDSYDSGTGQALFTGTGTIIDNTGAYQNTPSDLTVTFSSPSAYTFSLEAVPEPATMSLAAAGLLGLLALRRRRY